MATSGCLTAVDAVGIVCALYFKCDVRVVSVDRGDGCPSIFATRGQAPGCLLLPTRPTRFHSPPSQFNPPACRAAHLCMARVSNVVVTRMT